MLNKASLLLLILVFTACAPKVRTTVLSSVNSTRPHQYAQPFALIEKDTVDMSKEQLLGEVKIIYPGLSTKYNFEYVKLMAKLEAMKMGANCMVIAQHKQPANWSTYHWINVNAYLIKNPRKYESEVIWSQSRKLVIEDFKGAIDKRPFTAATASSFRYNYKRITGFSGRYSIKIETYFDCKSSYFKQTKRDSLVLAHEQIHFDISELYSRKFMIRIQNEARTFKELVAIQQHVLNEIGREMQLKQDEYDSEVYADRSKQAAWNEWIKEELQKTMYFANKTFVSLKLN